MGTCLDTDQQNGAQVLEDGDARSAGKWRGEAGLLSTPPNGYFPEQNVGPVKFEVPNVPVIFVLGGPGSGKVTHCDNLMQEKKGITHINMMDLLQQYALGNDMQDFGQLSSKTVAEVLMLEIKMSPGSKVFLVSGYPRNMRDVVEYAEKIKIVNGVILVSWRQEILERQIDFGAQLGQVVIELARMELYNFYRNVMPVAEYFDQSGMLVEVNGERNPSEVYVDFREAVFKILGLDGGENREKNIPKALETEVEIERRKESIAEIKKSATPIMKKEAASQAAPFLPPAVNIKPMAATKIVEKQRKGLPAFIWVIGGPGSNKENLCVQAVRNMPGFVHVSVGNLLRTMANSNTIINDAIVSGEMVPQDIVMQLVEAQIMQNRDTDGMVIDGFPRDLDQLTEFENKFGQRPPLVLLDCSKLQLGRGRLDDSVSAFRKRLEIFREVSLPMLKTLDNENRLTIVDGDTDVPSVQNEFASALYQLSSIARRMEENRPMNGEESANIEDNLNKINANANLANSTNFNSNLPNSVNLNSNSINSNLANSVNSNSINSNLANIANSVNSNSINSNLANSTNLNSNLANLANSVDSTNLNSNVTNLASNSPNSTNLTSNLTNLATNAANLVTLASNAANLANSTNLTSNLTSNSNLTHLASNAANLANSTNVKSNLTNLASNAANLANSTHIKSNLSNLANSTSTNIKSNLSNLANSTSTNIKSNLSNMANSTSTNIKSNLTNLTNSTSTNIKSNLTNLANSNSTNIKSNLTNLANSTNLTNIASNAVNLTNSTNVKSNLTNLANAANSTNSNLKAAAKNVIKKNATSVANGVAKQLINEGKHGVEKAVSKNMNGLTLHGAATIANGLKSTAKQVQKNGAARAQNGLANGAAHLLQNGVAHLTNGIAAANNKVAPQIQNYLPNNSKDALRKMYNEVDGYEQNLHM